MASDIQKSVMWVVLTLAFLCYSFYLYSSMPVQDATYSAEVDRGKALWQQHNCTACHQVYGLGGYLGPDLTNVYSLRGPEYITVFLKYGNQTMPAYQMEASDIQAMLAYLRNIDQSGVSDPRSFNTNYDGTIEQQQK
jgi:nitric oxide reductase subunit C